MMKRYFVVALLVMLAVNVSGKDDKNDKKNQKAVEKEEGAFEKNLRKNPDNYAPYLEHANSLAVMPTEFARAGGFYLLALKYDSVNAQIYKDYGMYQCDKMHAYGSAKDMLMRAITLKPGDPETTRYIDAVNKVIAVQDAENKLRDFGTATDRTLNPAGNMKSLTQFDSLKEAAVLAGGEYNYDALIKRFLADDKSLTGADMYMLIVGFTTKQAYNAFSYNEINEMRMMAGSSIDGALKLGLELVKANPLNPTLNRELMYYYRKKEQPAEADKYLRRVQQFFSGVLWSGNGSCERPYIALWSKEEYNFLTYLGYKATDSHYMGQCAGHMAEIIDAQNLSTQKTEAVHFDVGLIYMQSVGK